MKLRKLAAAALTAAMTLSLAAPALAAESADARLTQVTLAVKKTLSIGDEYTQFYGEPNETPLGVKWDLNWSAEEKSLSVTATDTGKVLGYNRSAQPVDEQAGNYGPSFPEMSRDEARAKAEEFLNKVLTDGETAVIDDDWSTSPSLDARQYGFGGSVFLNGVPTPMSFRVWVWAADGEVSNFWRDDESEYVGDIPAADTVTTADKARAQLAGTLEMELIYVRDDPEQPAVLRYVPRSSHDFYVDAATGELIDLTELREKLAERGTSGAADKTMSYDAASPEAAAETNLSLSRAEQEGVAKLEGVLTSAQLDAKVRAWTELKLTGFELSGCSYSVEREDGDPIVRPMPAIMETAAAGADGDAAKTAKVTARMSYNRMADGSISRRTVSVDARTGELLSMSGYNAYQDKEAKTAKANAQKSAEAFLAKLWGDQFAKTELYKDDNSDSLKLSDAYSFTYAQKANGYFFPENSITVRVSADNGAIMGFSRNFDDDVTFDSAEGLIDLAAAKTAWAGTFSVELGYIAVPVSLDLLGGEVRPLINAGYSYYNSLKPGYELGEQDGWYSGIDAKTGKPVQPEESPEPEGVSYNDIAGHWAETALKELAEYNVGWYTEAASPEGALKQLDYVALLCSADGYRYVPGEDDPDELYDYAIRRGLLARDARNDGKTLTRAEMIQMMLDSLGYKEIANLQGIFTCGYADADRIPAGHMGYAALAQGLGLVSGDEGGSYAPDRGAIRGEAAVMLWRYMKR